MQNRLKAAADYILDPAELPALRSILVFQNTFPVSRTLTNADIGNYFNMLERLSGDYNAVKNAKVKAWYGLVFTPLTAMDQLGLMYQVYCYRRYVAPIWFDEGDCWVAHPWYSYWHTYRHGWYWRERDGDQDEWTYPGVGLPDAPAEWRSKAGDILGEWGEAPPEKYIEIGKTFNDYGLVHRFEDKLLNDWKDFPKVAERTFPLWEAQQAQAKAFKEDGNLDNKSLFYFLHLLIALGTGNQKMTDYVFEITKAKAPTDAYPEETFINQLTYLVLMYLGDAREPETKYNWNNGQLQQFVRDLRSVINIEKPGSLAIAKSLDLQLSILTSVASYPLIDPESSQSLSGRKADTRAALNKVIRLSKPDA